MKWNPIETAPADAETRVLLWFDGLDRAQFGITYRGIKDGKVRASSSEARGYVATHWMIVEPPQ